MARMAACTRSRLPVLASTLVTWVLTVLIDRCRRAAISVLLRPGADQRRARRRSRAVSAYAARSAGAGRPARADPVEHRPGHLGGEDRVAGGDRSGPPSTSSRAAAPLEQEAARAGRDGVEHVGVVVEGGHHDHGRRVRQRRERAGGGQPVEHRHPDVDQGDVDARVAPHGVQELPPVLGLRPRPRCRAGRRGSARSPRAPAAGRRRSRPGSGRSRRLHRQVTSSMVPPPGRSLELPGAAARGDPLLDAEQAGAARRRVRRPDAVVADPQADAARRRGPARPRRAWPARGGRRWSAPPGRCGRPSARSASSRPGSGSSRTVTATPCWRSGSASSSSMSSSRGGADTVSGGVGSRRCTTSASSSPSAVRPRSPIVRSARSGSLTWPASACTTIAVTWWPTTSCSSRARLRALLEPRGLAAQLLGLLARARWSASRDRSRSAERRRRRGSPTNGATVRRPRTAPATAPTRASPPDPAEPRAVALVLGDRDRRPGRRRPATGTTESPAVHAATNAGAGREHGRPPASAGQARRRTTTGTTTAATAYDVGPARPTRGQHRRRRPRRRRRRTSAAAAGAGRRSQRPERAHPASLATRDGPVAAVGAKSVPGYRSAGTAVRHREDGTAAGSGESARRRPCAHDALPSTPRRRRTDRSGSARSDRAQPGHAASAPSRPSRSGCSASPPATCALLALAYAVYWVGDILDGWSARRLGQETRLGAVLDIVSDRACTSVLCVGLLAHLPGRAAGGRGLPAVVHGAGHDAVAGVPVLADPRPQRLPPGRPPGVAAQLVAAGQGRQHRRRRGAPSRSARTPSALVVALAVVGVKVWSAAAWSACWTRTAGDRPRSRPLLALAYGVGSALRAGGQRRGVRVVARRPDARRRSPSLVVLALAVGQTVGKLVLFEAARRGPGRLGAGSRAAGEGRAGPVGAAGSATASARAHRPARWCWPPRRSACRRWRRSASPPARPASAAGSSGCCACVGRTARFAVLVLPAVWAFS